MRQQLNLFGAGPVLPEGFRYEDDLITRAAETALVEQIRHLPFRDFEFQGYVGKRRVVSFGLHYDFAERALLAADDIPPFLLPVRDAAARFADVTPASLQHVLVTEYGAGAGIGWHRDRDVFSEVIGISLLAPCTFRLRRQTGDSWERISVSVEPRSAYLLSGPSRTEWEHSIPPVDALRYSITFRNLRER
ncbi:MAG: 2OG-Fe(II) oxygenase [Gemmatimonadetes bacterium]|jgi:alkylated DNA repair dioxygenase AlkB|nr:2OG-Fe(II) oxygenase [Gemmatimonadota bacterium]